MKIHPEGAELFHVGWAGRQTDMKKLTVALGNFAKALKKKIMSENSWVVG